MLSDRSQNRFIESVTANVLGCEIEKGSCYLPRRLEAVSMAKSKMKRNERRSPSSNSRISNSRNLPF
jgi:hypothetical protein